MARRNANCYDLFMRVLIVGCGYTGLPLGAELVRQGHEVFGLRRSDSTGSGLRAVGIQPLFADVAHPQDLRKIPGPFDWVVNTVSSTRGGVDEYRQVYLEGTLNLIDWLRAGNQEIRLRQQHQCLWPNRRVVR